MKIKSHFLPLWFSGANLYVLVLEYSEKNNWNSEYWKSFVIAEENLIGGSYVKFDAMLKNVTKVWKILDKWAWIFEKLQ